MLNERHDIPQGRAGAPLHPGGAPDPTESPESHAFKERFLSHFTDGFQASRPLGPAGVAGFVSSLREKVGSCSTFRVRKASAGKLAVRLLCDKLAGEGGGSVAWDATITIEQAPPHRIAQIENAGITDETY